jgi:hypothetical protein
MGFYWINALNEMSSEILENRSNPLEIQIMISVRAKG